MRSLFGTQCFKLKFICCLGKIVCPESKTNIQSGHFVVRLVEIYFNQHRCREVGNSNKMHKNLSVFRVTHIYEYFSRKFVPRYCHMMIFKFKNLVFCS